MSRPESDYLICVVSCCARKTHWDLEQISWVFLQPEVRSVSPTILDLNFNEDEDEDDEEYKPTPQDISQVSASAFRSNVTIGLNTTTNSGKNLKKVATGNEETSHDEHHSFCFPTYNGKLCEFCALQDSCEEDEEVEGTGDERAPQVSVFHCEAETSHLE